MTTGRRCGTLSRFREDAGFTLAEVLVSITLFTIMSASASVAIVGTVKTTRNTQNRVVATNLARQEIERLRLQSATARQLDATAQTTTLKGRAYTITPTMTPAATGTCATGSTRNVTVKVTWPNSGARAVRVDTVLAC